VDGERKVYVWVCGVYMKFGGWLFCGIIAFCGKKSNSFCRILIILLKIVEKLQKSHKIFAYLKIM